MLAESTKSTPTERPHRTSPSASTPKLKLLARKLLHRLATLKTSCSTVIGNKIHKQQRSQRNPGSRAQDKEIEENEANERLLQRTAAGQAGPLVCCVETRAGCFYWDTGAQRQRAADMDLART